MLKWNDQMVVVHCEDELNRRRQLQEAVRKLHRVTDGPIVVFDHQSSRCERETEDARSVIWMHGPIEYANALSLYRKSPEREWTVLVSLGQDFTGPQMDEYLKMLERERKGFLAVFTAREPFSPIT